MKGNKKGLSNHPSVANLPINYLKEAFFTPVNLGFLALLSIGFVSLFAYTFFADSLSHLIPLPQPDLKLFLGYFFSALGLESILVSVISTLPSFQEAVRRKYKEDPEIQEILELLKRIKEIGFLNEETLARYLSFLNLKEETERQMMNLFMDSASLYETLYQKLERLDSIYLQTLTAYTLTQSEAVISRELHSIQAELETLRHDFSRTDHPHKKSFLMRRMQMLEKRMSVLHEIKEQQNLFLLKLQMLEDTLKYLKDMMQTLYPPTEYLNELDRLIEESELHLNTFKEISHFLNFSVDESFANTEREIS